jgi:hypothetical protein
VGRGRIAISLRDQRMVAVEEEQFSYLVAGFKLGLVKRVGKATNPRILPQLQQ